MFRITKIISSLLVAFVLFFAVAITILLHSVKLDFVKDQISAQLTESLHTTVSISGPLHWSFFPWVGMRVEGIEMVGNHLGVEKVTPLLKLKEADISIRLLPLFIGRVELGGVKLTGMNLYLTCNMNNVCNWQMPSQRSSTHEQTPTDDENRLSIHLQNLDISSARIRYINEAKHQDFEVVRLGLHSQNISLDKPFTLLASAKITDHAQQNTYQSDLTALIQFKDQYTQFDLNNVRFKTTISNPAWGKRTVSASIQGNAHYGDEILIEQLKASIARAELTGRFRLLRAHPFSTAIGTLSTQSFSPRSVANALGISLTGMPIEGLKSAVFKLDVKHGDLQLKGKLDGQTIEAHLAVSRECLQNDKCRKQPIETQIKIDRLDVDRYWPIRKAVDQKRVAVASPTQGRVRMNIPPKLRTLSFQGAVSIGQLKLKNVLFSQLEGRLTGASGKWSLKPLSGKLYDGEATLNVDLDLRTQPVSSLTSINVRGVNVGDLLTAISGHHLMSAPMDAKIEFGALGLAGQAFLQSLNGKGEVIAGPGTLQGIDLNAKLRSLKSPTTKSNELTAFDVLGGRFVIQDGVLTSKDLFLKSKSLNLKGSGGIAFPAWTIGGELEAETTLGDHLLTLPIKITGSLSAPSIQYDLTRHIARATQGMLNNLLNQAMQSIG